MLPYVIRMEVLNFDVEDATAYEWIIFCNEFYQRIATLADGTEVALKIDEEAQVIVHKGRRHKSDIFLLGTVDGNGHCLLRPRLEAFQRAVAWQCADRASR